MAKTIGDLKIGDRLVMGRYTINAGDDREPKPIVWLKATPDCCFLSEYALDIVVFDGREPESVIESYRSNGNPCFTLSNLACYLNSEYQDWYFAMHQNDSPPFGRRISNFGKAAGHAGFLYDFEEYEIESLVYRVVEDTQGASAFRIWLPSKGDVFGNDCFPLFRRKGIRPKASMDMIGLQYGYDTHSFVDFWLMTQSQLNTNYVERIARNGLAERVWPSTRSGLRPVCAVRPDRAIEPIGSGMYRLVPSQVTFDTFSDEDFYKLMGIAHP